MTLLGRSRELDLLGADISAGRPALVCGEAGIGKTSLARAAGASCGLEVFEGLCLSTMWWVSFQALRRALSLGDAEVGGDLPAVAVLVRERVGDGLLLLDDVHWADRQTKDLLPMLAGRVRMLVTMRSEYPGFETESNRLCAAGFEQHRLGALDAATTVQVVRATRPNLDPERVGVVARASGGNPLLAEELAKTDSTSAVLATLVETRVRDLSPAAREALARLALLGRPAPRDLAGRLCGEPALRSLQDAELVVTGDAAVAIRHGLIGEWALAAVPAAARRVLHREIALAVADPGEAARHRAAAGDRHEAHQLALAASRRAPTVGERIAHLRVAAECGDGPAADRHRREAVSELMQARECEAALALAAAVKTDDDEALAWVRYWEARGFAELLHVEDAAAAVAAGLELAPAGSEVSIRLREEDLRRVMYVDWNLPEVFSRAAALSDDVAAIGVELGRSPMYAGFARMLLDAEGWEENLEAVRTRAREGDDWNLYFEATQNAVLGWCMHGRMAQGRELAAAAAVEAGAAGTSRWETEFRALETTVACFLGDYDATLDAAPGLLAGNPTDRDRDMLSAAYALALADRGHLDAAAEVVNATLGEVRSLTARVVLPFVQAEIAFWTDRPEAAAALLDAIPDSGATGTPTLFLRPTRWWVRLETGQDPGPPLPRFPFPLSHGPASETAAVGRLADGTVEAAGDAAALFAQGAEEYAGCFLRGELRCRWGRGLALLRIGREDDAAAELLTARAGAAAAGMAPLLRRIDAALRDAGAAVEEDVQTARPSVLSERERQTLGLVASGLTYAQIGRRLGISPRTVESYVTTARRKLGARSRAEAILLAEDTRSRP